jgi:hypothetical protein
MGVKGWGAEERVGTQRQAMVKIVAVLLLLLHTL